MGWVEDRSQGRERKRREGKRREGRGEKAINTIINIEAVQSKGIAKG